MIEPVQADNTTANWRTRILCTLGPASEDIETIVQMVNHGARAFRLNFSHGCHEDHAKRYALVRQVEEESGIPLAVLADMQGPKIRIGEVADGAVVTKGQKLSFHLEYGVGDSQHVALPCRPLFEAARPGGRLLIDDGKLAVEIVEALPDRIDTVVLNDGRLLSRKGVSVPDAVLSMEVLTEKDHADLDYALGLGVNWVALSFVQTAQNIVAARARIPSHVGIMAKIERPVALDNISAIIEASDGVMVARGDLGVEIGIAKVPMVQKQIVRECRLQGKPVVVATHMLESMVQSPVPTRAEVSDIATAVGDGADAVMLSAESATGTHPLRAVQVMANVIQESEKDSDHYQILNDQLSHQKDRSDADAISRAAASLAFHQGGSAIACFTVSGATAVRVSRFRPPVRILCIASQKQTAQRMALVWGLECLYLDDLPLIESILAGRPVRVSELPLGLNPGERIFCTAGTPLGKVGSTNMLCVHTVQ